MRLQGFQQAAWLALLGLVAVSLVWSTPTLAQEKTQRRGACAEDEQKLCPDAKTRRERAQCLKSHEAELSQACKDRRARMAQVREKGVAKRARMQEACKGDTETFCKDVKPGRGSLTKCLKSHEVELSAACKDALPKGKGKAS